MLIKLIWYAQCSFVITSMISLAEKLQHWSHTLGLCWPSILNGQDFYVIHYKTLMKAMVKISCWIKSCYCDEHFLPCTLSISVFSLDHSHYIEMKRFVQRNMNTADNASDSIHQTHLFKGKQEEGFIRTAERTRVGYFLFAGRRFQLQSCWLTCERVRVRTKATLHFPGFHNAEHRLDGRLKNKVCPSHFSNEKHPKCLQWRMLLTSKLSPLLRASICSDLGQDSVGSVKQAKVLLRMIKF